MAASWQDRLKNVFTSSLGDLNPFKQEESYVAVDIGSSTIKVIEARTVGKGLELLNWAVAPTPSSAIQSNMVAEPEGVAEVLRSMLDGAGIKAKRAITAVPGPAVMIKRVNVPAASQQELENTVVFEAGNFIPEELDNVNLDYQVMGVFDAANPMEVMLVAAKKDIVGTYSDSLRAAGLLPAVIDVDYFALDNAYELNYDAQPDQVVALVNIGARYSSIHILKGGHSTFTGDVPVGGRDITEALTRDLGISVEEAERVKAGDPLQHVDPEQLSMALGPATDALIEEIHYALSFFWTAATDESIDTLYLSGGSAGVSQLRERLAERAEAPVELVDPLARVTIRSGLDAAALRERAAELTIAIGLAMRRPGDK